MINVSNHTKSISLSNHPCMARPTLINLDLDEYSQGFRCDISCNTLYDPSDEICVANQVKQEMKNYVFVNMITRINESKVFSKVNMIWM